MRYSQGENPMAIANYGIAVDRRGSKDVTDFFNVVAFGKAADFAEKYLHKGMKILVSGRLQSGSYTNKDGIKINTVDIIAESQEFCESKKDPLSNVGMPVEEIPDDLDAELPFAPPTR